MDEIYKAPPHTPAHLFRAGAAYMITAATYGKVPYISTDARKRLWYDALIFVTDKEGWHLIAWVVLDNHYHILLHAPGEGAERLPQLISSLHKFTARRWNDEDGARGRRVWWNYWDTCLTNERAYYARFNYIHWNPVKHGIVALPEDYPFSSYRAWLEEQGASVRLLEKTYPFDRIKVPDEF